MADDYWRKRAEADMDAVQDAASKRIARIGRAYRQAANDLADSVEKIIGRYAERFQLTHEEALKALNAPYDEDSRAYSYRMSRAEALREAAKQQADRLARNVELETAAQRAYTAKTAYSAAVRSLRDRMGAGGAFAQPDTGGLLRSIGTGWTGASYSKRIWANTSRLAQMLDKEVTAAYLSGKSNRAIGRAIMDRFAVGFREAERLVRTETSYVNNQAALQSYKDAGLEEYEYLTAKDSRTCKLCGGMDGKRFELEGAQVGKNMPPLHPNCRCTVVAVVEGALDGLTTEEAREWVKDGAPEDVEGWKAGRKAALQSSPGHDTITPDTKAAGSAGVQYVGKIDREIYKCVTPDITTDEVVITDERVSHIAAHHPNDFEKYNRYMLAALNDPDYILKDQPNTALILKRGQMENERFRLVLRLHTSTDNPTYKNSILTFMVTNEKKWEQNVNNKCILYKRKGL